MLLTNLVLFASLFGAVLAVVPPAQPAINVQVHPNGRSHLCLAAASATEGGATFLRGCRGGDDTMAQWTVSNRTTYLRLTGTQWCLSIGTDFGAGYQPYNGDTDMVLAKCPTSGIPGPLASFPGQTWIYGGSGTSSQDCHFRMVHSGYTGPEYCLDNKDGANRKTQIWECHDPSHSDNNNQRWTVTPL